MKSTGWNQRSALVALGVVAIMTLGISAGIAGANFRRPAPPAAPVIAVIDLEQAFDALNERTDLEAHLKTRQSQLLKAVEDLQAEAKSKQIEIDQLSGASKVAKRREASEAILRSEIESQISIKKLDGMRAEMRRDLYLKIVDACQRLARQNGYAMVFASDDKVQVPMADSDTVSRAISFKRMLHVDPAMDITSDVVTSMNNEYASGVSTPPPAKRGGN